MGENSYISIKRDYVFSCYFLFTGKMAPKQMWTTFFLMDKMYLFAVIVFSFLHTFLSNDSCAIATQGDHIFCLFVSFYGDLQAYLVFCQHPAWVYCAGQSTFETKADFETDIVILSYFSSDLFSSLLNRCFFVGKECPRWIIIPLIRFILSCKIDEKKSHFLASGYTEQLNPKTLHKGLFNVKF